MRLIDLVTEDMLKNFGTTKEELLDYPYTCPSEMGFEHNCKSYKNDMSECGDCYKEKISKDSTLYIQHSGELMYRKAKDIAFKAHKGQKDKSGKSYINHPLHVAFHVVDYRDKIVAILHDTIEDTFVTIDYLRESGINDEELLNDLLLVTHVDEDSYKDYIEKIYQSGSERAKRIKLLDLSHNMDINRLNKFKEKDIDRITKYAASYIYLKTGEWLKEI